MSIKHFFLFLLVWVLVPGVQAQQRKGAADMKAAFAKKMVSIPMVTDPAGKVHQSIKKVSIPQVHLDLDLQMAQVQQQCPLLRIKKTTLELEGERANPALVELRWEATNGYDHQRFLIERSLDDTSHFTPVNQVMARQRSSVKNNYRLPDGNTHDQVSYYRVKLTLMNGETLLSNIAAVKGWMKDFLSVYPNPSSERVQVFFPSVQAGSGMITVYDPGGRMVVQHASEYTAGPNVRELPVHSFVNGVYTVRVDLPDGTVKKARFVKQ